MPRAKSDKKQSNFRLSEKAGLLVELAAKKSGLSKTEIVELCLAKYAIDVAGLAEEARKVVVAILLGDDRKDNKEKK